VPIPTAKNNTIQGINSVINYTTILEETRLEDFNHSILIPAGTIILCDAKKLLPMINANEFNLSFTQERLMKSFNDLKTKKLNKGLIRTHEVTEWLMNNTPYYLDRDSIKQSLELIELNKTISTYETVVPHELFDEYLNTKKSLERVKPINNQYNLACLRNGLAFSGPDTTMARDGLRIKHHSTKSTYEFGQSFYTLGQLGKLCTALDDLWNR
jgi:hypothetical protein